MKYIYGCIVLSVLILSTVATAQNSTDELREQLIREVDKRLQEVRQDLIREIDRRLAQKNSNYLGVVVAPVPPGIRILLNLPARQGVIVTAVEPSSPAQQAGIACKDILLEFAGHPINSPDHFKDMLQKASSGQKSAILLQRNTRKISLTVVLQKRAQTNAPRERSSRKLKELLRDFSEIPEHTEKWAEQFEDLQKLLKDPEKLLEDPEKMKLLEDMLKKGREYFKKLQRDPSFPQELDKQLEQMFELLQQRKTPLPPEMQELLRRLLPQPPKNSTPQSQTSKKSDDLDGLLDDLLEDSRGQGSEGRPYLGLVVIDVPQVLREVENLPPGHGVLVSQIASDSPAAKVQIQRWDILLSIDGRKINSPKKLARIISIYKPGKRITMAILSHGKIKKIKVTLGSTLK